MTKEFIKAMICFNFFFFIYFVGKVKVEMLFNVENAWENDIQIITRFRNHNKM